MASASLTACVAEEGPMGPMGPQGPKGEDGEGCNWEVIEFDVPADAWTYNQEMNDPNHGYYSTTLDCPEITSDIYSIGIITVYVMASDFQSPLPYVRFNYNENNELWTSTIDCEIQVGKVNVFITNSDFYVDEALDYKFRVAMIY